MPTLTLLDSTHGFTAGDLVTSNYVAVVPAFQTFWFADGRKQADGGYHRLNMNNDKLTGVATGTFSRGEGVTQAGSDAEGIFDESIGNNHFIYRTTTTPFNLTGLITGATSGATVTPTAIGYPPHWLDWNTRVLDSPAAATGLITDATNYLPYSGANIGCLFGGRVYLNSVENPNQWIASRHRDPQDFLVSQDDVGTPVSSQTSKLGIVGDAITAMVPYLDHYLYFGCMNEIWIMRGDPGSGAQITNVSRTVGMFGPDGHCFDDKGNCFFMAMDGFYVLAGRSGVEGEPPENLTNTRMPGFIKALGLNRRTDRVCMEYDKDRYGIDVSIVQYDGQYGVKFFWDLRLNAMDPESFAEGDHYPASMLYYNSRVSSTRGLLMGGQDGYIRKWDDTAKDDDGSNAIDSYLTLGPFQAWPKMRQQGQLTEMSFRLGEDSDGATAQIYAGDAAETVVNAVKNVDTPKATETLTGGGRRPAIRPRTIGSVFCIQLRNNSASERFALERVTARITDAGKVKGA